MKIEEITKNLNTEQCLAVQTMQNVVVSAGAGSGKTKTLSARYINLVLEKKLDISSIFALTFTNKAATEMYERIYKDLQKYSDNPYAQKAIQNFEMANIGTLDSFCNSIVRYSARQYGLSPDFSIDEHATHKLAKEVGTAFFLKNIKEDVIKDIIASTKNDVRQILKNLFIAVLQKYVYISRPLNLSQSIKIQKQILKEEFSSLTSQITEIVEKIKAIEFTSEKKAKGLLEAKDVADKILVESPSTPFEKNNPIYSSMLCKVRPPSTSKQEDAILCTQYLKEVRPLVSSLQNICNYNVKLIVRTFFLLKKLQREYINAKIASNILSYGDVPHIALDALKNDVELRNYYKKKIKAIMVDEFQDNNQLQRDILFLIAEKDERSEKSVPEPEELSLEKLFFVGDEKQSIYAFRGAEVSVFRKLSAELQNEIKLRQNYRTEKPLIDVFNYIFPSIFALGSNSCKNEIQDDKINFEAIEAFQNTANIASEAEVLFFDKSLLKDNEERKIESPQDYEAYTIAKRIKEMHEAGFVVRDEKTGEGRPCEWSDFAILLRASTRQSHYERYLKMAGIPYTASTQKYIFQYALINDFYSIFRLAVYPEDEKAYSQFLKTPFVNISDVGFAQIIMEKLPPFSDKLDSILSAEDLKCFVRGREIFCDIQSALKEKTNAQILQKLMYEWGYVYLLLHKEEYQNFLELYDYFFYIATCADDEGQRGCEFVDELSEYIGSEEEMDEMDIPVNQKKDSVKIMTIHKSKGLEFPIVIVADCNNSGKPYKKDGIVFFDSNAGLCIHSSDEFEDERKSGEEGKNNFFFEKLREAENRKIREEAKRLFYVACTRAEVKLILSGVVENKTKERSTEEISGKQQDVESATYEDFLQGVGLPSEEEIKKKTTFSFFDFLAFAIAEAKSENIKCEELKLNFYEIPIFENLFFEKVKKKQYKKIAEHALLYKNLKVKEFGADDSHLTATAKGTFDGKIEKNFLFDEQERSLEIGEIAHSYLEASLKGKTFNLKQFDLTDEEASSIELYKMNFLNSQLGKMALNAKIKKMEYGFATMYKEDCEASEKLTLGVIDLFFEYEETVYIVDYKTDKRESDKYRRQLSVYKKAVGDLYATSSKFPTIKTYLFYLYLNKEVEFDM